MFLYTCTGTKYRDVKMSEIKVNAVQQTDMPEYTQAVGNAEASEQKKMFDIKKPDEVDEYKASGKTDSKSDNDVGQIENYTPASKLDNLDKEKQKVQDSADTKKSAIKDEIEDLIKNDKTISDNIKKEYIELNKDQKAKSEQLRKKEKEAEELKRNIDIAQAELIRRQTEKENLKDDSRKSEIDNEIEQYQKDISSDNKKLASLNSEITKLNNSISSLDKKMEKLIC